MGDNWISVKDRLPEDKQSVFVYAEENNESYSNKIQTAIFRIYNTALGSSIQWKVDHFCESVNFDFGVGI